MPSSRVLAGELVRYDQPDWDPIVALLSEELAEWFMWMCEVALEDGRRVHAYKHIETRRYLHLGTDGSAWRYWAGAYLPITPLAGVLEALCGWDLYARAGANDAAARAAVEAAIARVARDHQDAAA